MNADELGTIRWHARIGHAVAAGTAPWQHASLAAGLTGLVLAAISDSGADHAFYPLVAVLHLALLSVGLWLGLRLRIDAGLLKALADCADLDGFDRVMRESRLMPNDKTGRPMSARIAGLLRLSRLLALMVLAQLVLLAVAGAPAWR